MKGGRFLMLTKMTNLFVLLYKQTNRLLFIYRDKLTTRAFGTEIRFAHSIPAALGLSLPGAPPPDPWLSNNCCMVSSCACSHACVGTGSPTCQGLCPRTPGCLII